MAVFSLNNDAVMLVTIQQSAFCRKYMSYFFSLVIEAPKKGFCNLGGGYLPMLITEEGFL